MLTCSFQLINLSLTNIIMSSRFRFKTNLGIVGSLVIINSALGIL